MNEMWDQAIEEKTNIHVNICNSEENKYAYL